MTHGTMRETVCWCFSNTNHRDNGNPALVITTIKRVMMGVFLFFLSATGLYAEDRKNEEIIIVSESWADATEKDGTGLYWDIMRQIYEPLGYNVINFTTNYSRSVYLVQTQKMDIFLGSYIDEQEDILYPRWHFDAEHVAAAYKPSVIKDWQGQESLQGRTVGWVKGYGYDEYLVRTNFAIQEVKNRRQGLSLVDSERIDMLIDAYSEIEEAFQENNKVDRRDFAVSVLTNLKLYPGFSDSERGKALRDIYDQRFELLLYNGQIAALFKQYEWEFFPFEVNSDK
ncbi:substrate-binding periplasmic protein [Enterovibrio norvegicus]|uniref:substrate-binding periplasmic protein n=1 Tax=Enterovibrio norvegicus TaxID=188144 RepID=UPI001E58E344|nr:transporter substrate-binding domain-containing protein [Enterovibrio norvegicus]